MDEISPKQWIIALLLVASIAFGAGNFYGVKRYANKSMDKEDNLTIQESNTFNGVQGSIPKDTESKKIVVYVTGAVNKPDVYELPEESRIKDAIEKAGGVTKEADLISINLAEKLSDGEEVVVPKKGESTSIAGSSTSSTNKSSKININTADAAELEKLPGIGEVKAEAIIQYRKSYGRFKTIHDITRVSGIGEKTFEKIKDLISVN